MVNVQYFSKYELSADCGETFPAQISGIESSKLKTIYSVTVITYNSLTDDDSASSTCDAAAEQELQQLERLLLSLEPSLYPQTGQ